MQLLKKANPFNNPTFYFWIILLCYYLFLFIYFERLTFPVTKDELHFWPTAVKFSRTYIPSLELLKNYGELNTPLPFIIFGLIEKLWEGGIAFGRTFNFICSITIAFIVGYPYPSRNQTKSLLALSAVLFSPYFIGMSTHLYTDIIAIFFTLCGCVFQQKRHFTKSVLCFMLGISCRQYMVAFPFALFLFEIYDKFPTRLMRGRNPQPKSGLFGPQISTLIRTFSCFFKPKTTCKVLKDSSRWVTPLIACFSLLGWIMFFGGLGPQKEIFRQKIITTNFFHLIPENCNYFLACLGVYFCLPEMVYKQLLKTGLATNLSQVQAAQPSTITSTDKLQIRPPVNRSLRSWITYEKLLVPYRLFSCFLTRKCSDKSTYLRAAPALAALFLGLLFAFFPPLQNNNFPVPEMGFLDKFLRLFCNDFYRMTSLYCLALLATLRFIKVDRNFFLVWINVLLMLKAHVAWDKYALPLIIILWFYWSEKDPDKTIKPVLKK